MLSALLDKQGTLERAVITKDAAGGRTATYATSSTAMVAVWAKGSSNSLAFSRPDFVGNYIIATDQSYSVRPGDRWSVGGVYYTVESVESFSNAAVSGETLILHLCTLRTI